MRNLVAIFPSIFPDYLSLCMLPMSCHPHIPSPQIFYKCSSNSTWALLPLCESSLYSSWGLQPGTMCGYFPHTIRAPTTMLSCLTCRCLPPQSSRALTPYVVPRFHGIALLTLFRCLYLRPGHSPKMSSSLPTWAWHLCKATPHHVF